MRRLLALILGVAAFGAAPAAAHASAYSDAVAATPGASAYWRLGDAAGTTIAPAVGTAAGTVSGVGFGEPGALSGDADAAVRFTGGGSISVAARPRFAAPFTVEAWLRPDGTRTNGIASDGTASGGSSLSNGWFLSTAADGSPRFDAGTTAGLVSVTGKPVAAGVWHHLVATVDAGAVTLYVDGAAVASAPVAGTPRAATGSTMRLGRAASGSSRAMRGWLDDVALYGAALDAATVARHFALGTGPAPATRFSAGPAGLTSSRSATLAFSTSGDQITYECRIDTPAWGPCRSPLSFKGIGEGAHTFAVRARDRYGRGDAAPAAYAWTVDSVAPGTVALAILPSALTPTASVSFSSEPGARFECLGAPGWAPCASPLTAPPGGRVSVRAVDAAGNADATPATLTVPAAPAAAQPVSALIGPNAAFGFWADGTAAGPDCSLDGAQWTPCGATLTTGPLLPGAHALSVRAPTAGGGAQTVTTTWTVTLPAPSLVGVQFPVLVYVPPAKKIGKSFPSSRLPAVRFSLNVGATVTLNLDRTSGAARGRHLRTWTVSGRAGANVSRLPIAVYRKLGAARYRLTANASGVAGASVAKAVRFQVVRKRAGR